MSEFGHEFKAVNGRVRGFASWRLQQKTLPFIDTVIGVLDEYRDYRRLVYVRRLARKGQSLIHRTDSNL